LEEGPQNFGLTL